jgi:ATP-binding cassette subfamily B protein
MAGLLRLVTTSFQVRLSHLIGAEFSIAIYERTLYQPYIVHLSRNSSEVIGGIINKSSSLVQNALYPLLTILASCLMLIMILGALFFINPLVSILTFTTFAGIYLIIIYGTQIRLARESALISVESNKVVKVLQEGLGGIRDVLLDATQSVYVDIYKRSDIPLRKSLAYLQIIGASPRFVIEAFGISLISGVAYFLSYTDEGVEGAIPVLGALALGAQRLLPILQQGYSAFTSLRGGHVSVMDALDLLDQPTDKNKFQENDEEIRPVQYWCPSRFPAW